jgi:hypothetical protein
VIRKRPSNSAPKAIIFHAIADIEKEETAVKQEGLAYEKESKADNGIDCMS